MSISQEEYFKTNVSILENYLKTGSLKELNKTLRIDKWHPASIFLLYLSFIGMIFTILTFLNLMVWIVFWFYALFSVILLGFIFAKPENRFNFPLVLIIFAILVFVPSLYGQNILAMLSADQNIITENLPNAFDELAENPFGDIEMYITTLMDILNWIMFIAFITLGGASIAEAFTLDFSTAARNGAIIGLAIAVLTIIYGIFALADVGVRPIWETVGDAWNDFLKNVGLAQLDQTTGATITNPYTIMNGFFKIFPIVITFVMLGVAFAMRKTDYQSILFAKSVSRENYTKVKTGTQISLPILIIVFLMALYVIGYFLVTADPEIVVNPGITLAFYLFAIIVLFLIGTKILILNRDMNILNWIRTFFLWTIFGIIGLWMWFQVFQPIAYSFNLEDSESGLISLSQNNFGGVFLEQLFLVATPETLIFQCFAIGLGNRIYFYFARTRIINQQIDKLHNQVFDLRQKLNEITIDTDSTTDRNIRRIARAVTIEKKIIFIEQSIKERTYEKHPTSNFILPTLISALIGSFFFSWYHSFRRGINFVDWWQNPMLGLVYFGAGFFLCLVCFFNFGAGIMVHGLNNWIAYLMYA